jgi:hypothetical protein
MLIGALDADTFALVIPIVSIIGGIAIAIVAIVMGSRKKELEHKERLIAMEKGLPIPESPTRRERPAHKRHRTGGLVCTFLGLALSFAMFVSGGPEAGVWGLPLLGIGVGLLMSSTIERREDEADRSVQGGA